MNLNLFFDLYMYVYINLLMKFTFENMNVLFNLNKFMNLFDFQFEFLHEFICACLCEFLHEYIYALVYEFLIEFMNFDVN